jgi:hypothetical protein
MVEGYQVSKFDRYVNKRKTAWQLAHQIWPMPKFIL